MASLEDNPVSTVGWARTYKHVLKLEIVGDTVVGKSSLLHQFSHGKFREQYLPTLGKYDGFPNRGVSVYRLHACLKVLRVLQNSSHLVSYIPMKYYCNC